MAYESCKRITGKPVILPYTCTNASAAEFKKGDLVKLDTAGTITVATAGSILGIAQADNPASATTEIGVDLIFPNSDLFEMVTSAVNAITLHGDLCDITFTAGAHIIADGTGDFVALWAVKPVGTSKAYQGTIKPASCQTVTGF